jgi:3-oxoacyl-[acyl-carrier protein] reductase
MAAAEQRSVIVTGSSRGIGRAVAERLAADGFAVTVDYAGNRQAADEAVAAIVAGGGRAIAVQADVSQAGDVTRLFDETEQAFGRVDALVNNAGVMSMTPIAETDDATFDRMFATNVRGTFLTLRAAAKRLRDGGSDRQLFHERHALAVAGLRHLLRDEGGGRSVHVDSGEGTARPVDHRERRRAGDSGDGVVFSEGKSDEQIARLANLNQSGQLGEPQDIARVVSFLLSANAV